MLVRQIADHQRRRLSRFDLRESVLIDVRVEPARFVPCLSLPAFFLGSLTERPVTAQFVIKQPLKHRQQRDRREMANQIGHGAQLPARCVIAARDEPLGPLFSHLRNGRMRF